MPKNRRKHGGEDEERSTQRSQSQNAPVAVTPQRSKAEGEISQKNSPEDGFYDDDDVETGVHGVVLMMLAETAVQNSVNHKAGPPIDQVNIMMTATPRPTNIRPTMTPTADIGLLGFMRAV